jgi:cytochrome P450
MADDRVGEAHDTQAPRRFVVSRLGWPDEVRYFRAMLRNYAEGALDLFRARGDVIVTRIPDRVLGLVHPRHVRHVLRVNAVNYPKSDDYEALRPLLGEGIFVSEGETWTRQRRLLAPEFRAAAAPRYLPVIVRDVEAFLAELWEPAVGGPPRDIGHDMMSLTLRVIGDAIFAEDFSRQADAIGRDLETSLAQATLRAIFGKLLYGRLPTPGNLRARRAERAIDAAVLDLIARARASNNPSEHDVLSRLLRARDAEGRPAIDDAGLLDQVKSLLLAGHETTSLVLTWTFYLLASHPAVLARLVDEVTAVLGGRAPEADDIPRLVYTRMVLAETMRLYPPVPVVTRVARADDEFDGIIIKAGDKVSLLPFVTHRHQEFWPRPDEFDPERWAPGATHEPYAYLPFLLGRRECLGEHFAILEGVVALAMMVARYALTRVDAGPIGSRPIMTLRLGRPLMMRIERR